VWAKAPIEDITAGSCASTVVNWSKPMFNRTAVRNSQLITNENGKVLIPIFLTLMPFTKCSSVFAVAAILMDALPITLWSVTLSR